MTNIPIATPIVIPSKSPISNPKSDLLSEMINVSLFEINKVWLLDLEITSEYLESVIVDFNSELFSKFIIRSSGIFVNFAASVIVSVVEFPPNKVECAKRVWVPVWLIGTYNTVDVSSLFFTG